MPLEEPDVETGSDHAARQENESFAASIGLEVNGSAEFIADVDALLEEYPDSDLGAEPANLPPLDVKIEWHAPKNQGRAQPVC